MRFYLPLLSLAFSSATTLAQAPEPTITFTGSPVTREAIRREAEDYIRATTIAQGTRPATRWVDAVCPSVIGLSATNADLVRQKIDAAAREAGVRIAKQPCKSNVVVAFAHNGSDLARKVAGNRRKIRAFTAANHN